jgi:hypothetical protein
MKSPVWSWLVAAALCVAGGTAQGADSQLLLAAGVAQADFSAYLREDFARSETLRDRFPRDPKEMESSRKLSRFLADADNYEMRIWREGNVIVVQFHPRPPEGISLRGGGGEYRIDGTKLSVIVAEMWQ